MSEHLTHLCQRHDAAKQAAQDYADDIEAVAEKAGVLPSVLKRYIAARCSEKYQTKREECDQLALLFEEVA